jgi:hypothetical protein
MAERNTTKGIIMNRRTLLTSTAAAGLFLVVGNLVACGASQINRVMAALRALPPFVIAFGLASDIQARILQGILQITVSFEIFRDNPTRGNLRNTLAVIQRLIADGVFNTGNAQTTQRLLAAIALVIFIIETINVPASAALSVNDDGKKVTIDKSQEAVIESKLQELENTLGIK